MATITCPQVNELLSAYLESELDTTTSLGVASHLESCVGCQREFAQLSEITKLIKTAGRRIDARDEPLNRRANTINNRVHQQLAAELTQKLPNNREQIAADSSTQLQQSAGTAKSVGVLPLFRRTKLLKRLLIAASILLAVGIISLTTVVYRSDYRGPLLSAVVSNHRTCGVIEATGIGWYKGEQMKALSERYQLAVPQLTRAGLAFDAGHPCKVYQAPFLHMIYRKASRQVSVYCGAAQAIARLRESEKSIAPDKLFNSITDNVRVTAFTTSSEQLWIVAGELSATEMKDIVTDLQDNISAYEQKAEIEQYR